MLQHKGPHEQVGRGDRGAQIAHIRARALRGGPGQGARAARAAREPGQRAKAGRHDHWPHHRILLRPLRQCALGLHAGTPLILGLVAASLQVLPTRTSKQAVREGASACSSSSEFLDLEL